MRTILKGIFAVLLAGWFVATFGPDAPTSADQVDMASEAGADEMPVPASKPEPRPANDVSQATAGPEWRDEATRLFLEENPGAVVEAMFTTNLSFWISMRDNGSRRDGFAEYACLALHQFGMPYGETVMISIWDAYAMTRDDLVKIGEHYCRLKPAD